jgi:hypothetical protein
MTQDWIRIVIPSSLADHLWKWALGQCVRGEWEVLPVHPTLVQSVGEHSDPLKYRG